MAASRNGGAFRRGPRWEQESVVSADAAVPEQMGRVFEFTKGLHATHLIDLGVRLGLFDRLAGGASAEPAALASALGLHADYVQIWCEAACALGVLDYEPGEGFRMAPSMDDVLATAGSAFYLGSFPRAHLEIARDYARAEALFRSGGVHPYAAHDTAFLASVAEATRVLPRMFFGAVLPALPDLDAGLQAGARVLDVGCGAGYALVEFAERYPAMRGVGIDPEPVSIGMASRLAEERGVADRVRFVQADASTLAPEHRSAFDLVTMFLVVHELPDGAKAGVLREAASALRPGGRLLVFDECYPSGPADLRDGTRLLAVMAQWYELTWGNVIDTREDLRALLAGAGVRVEHEQELSRFYIALGQVDEH